MNSNPIQPHTYSGLSLEFICDQIRSHYALPSATRCQLHALGMHETYQIEGPNESFMLRVYRPQARSLSDIRYETGLLEHLHRAGCPVATPVRTRTNTPVLQLPLESGEQLAVLFRFAAGTAPDTRIDSTQCRSLGHALAQIHNAADDFHSPAHRQVLDLDYLLDASVHAIDPWLNSGQRQLVQAIQQRLHNFLPTLPRTTPVFGPCHGDINPRNVHFDSTGQLTVFDFDQCGPGWRVFDIGKFQASLRVHKSRHELRTAFEQGYGSLRPLSTDEQRAIPGFMLVAQLWVMALQVYNADITAPLLKETDFWSGRVDALLQLEAESQNLWT